MTQSLAEIVDEKVEEHQPVAPRQRLLFFDIETAPMLAYIWQARTEYVGDHMVEHDTSMLSWSAKWENQKQTKGMVLTAEEAREQDDARIVTGLADLIRQADVIVGHNLNRFDVPMLNNRLLLQGLQPLDPPRTIDTLGLAKRSFRLSYNKLNYLAEILGIEGKLETSFGLWRDALLGDQQALNRMLRYNRQDVRVLEDVYRAMEPYVRGLPRLVDAEHHQQVACPTCGSPDLHDADKPYRTNASSFPMYRCGNCGRYCRSRSASKGTKLGVHPL